MNNVPRLEELNNETRPATNRKKRRSCRCEHVAELEDTGTTWCGGGS